MTGATRPSVDDALHILDEAGGEAPEPIGMEQPRGEQSDLLDQPVSVQESEETEHGYENEAWHGEEEPHHEHVDQNELHASEVSESHEEASDADYGDGEDAVSDDQTTNDATPAESVGAMSQQEKIKKASMIGLGVLVAIAYVYIKFINPPGSQDVATETQAAQEVVDSAPSGDATIEEDAPLDPVSADNGWESVGADTSDEIALPAEPVDSADAGVSETAQQDDPSLEEDAAVSANTSTSEPDVAEVPQESPTNEEGSNGSSKIANSDDIYSTEDAGLLSDIEADIDTLSESQAKTDEEVVALAGEVFSMRDELQSLTSEIRSLRDELSSVLRSQAEVVEQLPQVGDKPALRLLAVTQTRYCPECGPMALVEHEGQKHRLGDEDTFLGYRVAIEDDRIVLVSSKHQYSYFIAP